MIDPIDLFLHLDRHLGALIQAYGSLTYAILFLIIFCETGLVFAPFFPGDSLLFVAGTFAALGAFDIYLLFILLAAAAIIGDSVNYAMGRYVGEKFFLKRGLLKQEHLDKTNAFFEKHGGKTIVIARFVPIVRTIAPFVAGVGKMSYPKFLLFNVTGGIAWTALFLLGGYFFGAIPAVRENLTLVVIAIIVVSFIPAILEYLKHRKRK